MSNKIIVTTGDVKDDYEILGPVYFSVSNKGLFGSQLGTLVKKYKSEIDSLKKESLMAAEKPDWGVLYGEFSAGQNDFDKAFFISVQELKARASILKADAIISMRQDLDLDTNGFQYFYMQMYGTAVKFK
jgi:ABC-type phosphate transport system auxiliary subunit